MLARFVQTETGDLLLTIPDEVCEQLGWKEGDLIEIAPVVRSLETAGEKHHIEDLVHLRRVRM